MELRPLLGYCSKAPPVLEHFASDPSTPSAVLIELVQDEYTTDSPSPASSEECQRALMGPKINGHGFHDDDRFNQCKRLANFKFIVQTSQVSCN